MPRLAPVVLIALSLSLGCGTTRSVNCPLPASSSASTCTCNGACPAQFYAYVYAAGSNSELAAFPIEASTGGIGTQVAGTEPVSSPSMAVMDNAFLYASTRSLVTSLVEGKSMDGRSMT